MTTMDLVKPWRVIASILPVLYAALVIRALPATWLWLMLTCGVVLAAGIIASWWGYPFLALWPTFGGIFMLSACAIVLLINAPDYAVAPMTGARFEIPAAAMAACGFIIWGIYSTRKMLTY